MSVRPAPRLVARHVLVLALFTAIGCAPPHAPALSPSPAGAARASSPAGASPSPAAARPGAALAASPPPAAAGEGRGEGRSEPPKAPAPSPTPAPTPLPFESRSLVRELGFPPGTRVLLINADDAGLTPEVNRATVQVITAGLAGSATLLVPAPAAPEFVALARVRALDVGIHLCLNSEWGESLPFCPVLPLDRVPSLVGAGGRFVATLAQRDARARPAEVEAEFRAQIERARAWGLDPTHLDGHMGCYDYRPDLFAVALRIALEYALPLRVGLFSPAARKRGVPCPERFAMFYDTPAAQKKAAYIRFLRALAPGVTELAIHVAEDTPAWRALDPAEAALRTTDLAVFTDSELRAVLAEERIVTLGWRALRDLMRRWRAEGSTSGERPR
ncbi:MAG: ChbG/HpnK family deacetylase [Planctomycetes bacterium]|nr:ChbG/HpnK family deacetylase [Planctomycetota bacterium]